MGKQRYTAAQHILLMFIFIFYVMQQRECYGHINRISIKMSIFFKLYT